MIAEIPARGPNLRLPLLIVVVVVAGCGGGDRTTETRAVAPFERLEIADSVDVRGDPATAARCGCTAART